MIRFLFPLILAASILVAQPTQTPMPAPMPALPGVPNTPTSVSIPLIPMRDPGLYLVSDSSVDVSQISKRWYQGPEKLTYGAIKSLSAVTNNLATWIKVEVVPGTDLRQVMVRLYIDSDGNVATGSGVGYYPEVQQPIEGFGFDYVVNMGWWGASVRRQAQECCINGYAEIVDQTSTSLTVKIFNGLFRQDGEVAPARFQATLLDSATGMELSIAPRVGVAEIPTTTMVRLSPTTGTRHYKVNAEDTVFPLTADMMTVVPDSQATYFILVNGINMTDVFLKNWREGRKLMNQARAGGPNYWTFTRRFVYPVDSIIRSGGRVRIDFILLTSDGVARDSVEYSAEQIDELPIR